MKRAVSQLSEEVYDLAIVGGGIYGAWMVWDAALRGLSVALLDQGDFGNATSANSHKIIHGGLRYLQHADFKRMRESIRERSILLRIAPRLIHPTPFLVPTYGHWIRGKSVMRLALKLNDIIGYDRNRRLEPEKNIPRGQVISKDEFLRLCPGVAQKTVTGGAIFYDAQVSNPNRLILSILHSSEEAGANLANYVRVTGLIQEGTSVTGLLAKDLLSGNSLRVRARMVVNCSGPWVDQTLDSVESLRGRRKESWFKAIVLVVRPLFQTMAVGFPADSLYNDEDAFLNKGARYFFVTPWRNTSLVGTFYSHYDGDPGEMKVHQEEITDSIAQINRAYPLANLKRDDVHFINAGLLPRGEGNRGDIQYMKHYKILDHEKESGVPGLISVIGVKLTTARDVAEKVTNLVLKKLGKRPIKCQTADRPIHGGTILQPLARFPSESEGTSNRLGGEVVNHLLNTYGSEYSSILRYSEGNPEWAKPVIKDSPVIKAEVIHGIREEMAQSLADVIFRRTELGTAGYPGDSCLESCAEILACELGWSSETKRTQIEEVRESFLKLGCRYEQQG